MIKKIVIIGGLVVFAFSNMLTLNEAITKTLKNHPDIKSFMLKLKQSQKSIKSAKSAYLPQINLDGKYNFSQTYTTTLTTPTGNIFKTTQDTFGSIGVTLKQKIWDFGKTSALVDASITDKDISKISLKEAKALLVYKVKMLYETMIIQKQAIKIQKQDLKVKQEYYKQAVALKKEGLKTAADEARFLSSVYLAKANLENAKINYNKAKQTLSLYMNEKLGNIQLEHFQSNSIDNNIKKEILKNNYNLKIDELSIKKNQLLHKAQKDSHYGNIDLIANYSRIYALNDYNSKMIGISVSIPLYLGGKLTSEEQKAKIAIEMSAQKKASKVLALKDEIDSILLDIQNFNQQLIAKQKQLKALKDVRFVVDGRYKAGLATYIDVLDAQSNILNTQLSILEVRFSKNMAIAKLNYLKGMIK